ncbi:hypothetical protein [Aureimonas sp. ME7]|uniref:hypothetical protein n=1 Tax=Aureimonas sp. ME7 TaxID=2744252 RepID=UPI0015F62A5B|nr:hypothetical protein [Aureimonas sp. ME7]
MAVESAPIPLPSRQPSGNADGSFASTHSDGREGEPKQAIIPHADRLDERTAIQLLLLANQLLRPRHAAIAGMIDYAIAEIEDADSPD